MIVKLYYDDCKCCFSDDRSHLEFLKKDRIIEVWIGEEE